jgi:hypothetical protein
MHGAGTVGAVVRGHLETSQPKADLSLLFAVGERPSAADIERLLASEAASGQRAQISHRPDDSEGWLELLANGLTFDITGLVPAGGTDLPPMEHQFGISLDPAKFRFEAMTIAPGRHIAGGGAMVPVVRTMIGLAAAIAVPLSAKAVCWHPARSWMEPGYFTRTVANWLAGGGFPALGLTAVVPHEEGGVQSVGLRFFAGQEVRAEPLKGEPCQETVKLAVRVIDHIIRHGPLTSPHALEGPSGETMQAEPSQDGRQVRVWRTF